MNTIRYFAKLNRCDRMMRKAHSNTFDMRFCNIRLFDKWKNAHVRIADQFRKHNKPTKQP